MSDGDKAEGSEEVGGGETAVGRRQHVLHVMPHDWESIVRFLAPLIDRIDAASRSLQLLVVTRDPESAAVVGAAAVRLLAGRDIGVVAATSARRAARLLGVAPAAVVVGDASTLLELTRGSVLSLGSLRAVAIAGADAVIASGRRDQLEALFADIPKEAIRTIVTGTLTPEVETLVEHHARRARRVIAVTSATELAGRVI